mgnify:CR=1 FL=1
MPDIKTTFLRHTPKNMPTLSEMYSLPLIYGTSPGSVKWSPDNETLAFLWNEKGMFVRDIYISKAGESPKKITNAENIKPLPVEDDERPKDEVEYSEKMYSGISQFEWSPDGKWLAYLCRGDIFRITPDGKEHIRLTQTSSGRSGMKISPDGKFISFTIGANVWSLDIQTGAVMQLTFFGKEEVKVWNYLWSYDGKWIAIHVEDQSMYEKVKMPDYSPEKEVKIKELRRNNVGKPLSKVRVGIIPSSGGKMVRIPLTAEGEEEKKDKKPDEIDTGNNIRMGYSVWTWDSSRLIVSYRGKSYRDFHLVAVEPGKESSPVEIYTEKREPWFCISQIAVSPDSKHVYFLSHCNEWRHLYRVPVTGGKVLPVTTGNFDVPDFQIPKNGKALIYTAHAPDPRDINIFSIPFEGGTAKKISPEFPANSVVVSDNGESFAFMSSRVMVPPEIFVSIKGSPHNKITNTPLPAFEKIKKPKMERIQFTNKSDGATIYAKMFLPYNFDPKKKYPAVLTCVYAGGGKEGFGRYQLLDTYMANEMGYVLVGIDLRASAGYGGKFQTGYYKSMGIIDAEECVSCAEYLKTLPYIDGSRLGIWGGSYGGFLVLMVMCKYPIVFNTGISWKPVTDWRNYWDSYTGERLTRPQDDMDAYKATSPVFHAEGLQGNLLLVHAMLDDNVLFQDSVWMMQKLIEAGKYFDLMVYPKDDHLFTLRYESLPDCMERFAAYFEEHMGLGPV